MEKKVYWHTTYGMIEVEEQCFRTREGNKVVRPFLNKAQVKTRGYSLVLQEAITDFGADEPFAKVVDKVKRHYGVDISFNAARTVTLHHAHEIKALAIERNDQDKPARTLIAEMDGSMAPCVKMDETATDRRKSRKTEWKEVKLCLVRAPEKARPVFAVTSGGADKAGQLLAEAAKKTGLDQHTYVHGIGDGASWIADQMDLRFGTQGHYLIDFYHVSEYLAAAAPYCAEDTKAWLTQQQANLKANKIQEVLESLAPHLESEVPESQGQKPVRKAYQYLSNKQEYLDYQGALERELPIGSGEVESGHRQVIQKRIKRAGAWWLIDNVGDMANMIAARLNNVWDSYWKKMAA